MRGALPGVDSCQRAGGPARRVYGVIAFPDRYEIRREAAGSAMARQGKATTYRIDLEMESRQRRQLGHTQRQPLHAVAREVDLRPRIVTHTFERHHGAFAKLGVEHLHALA